MNQASKFDLAIIGLGYVGLPLGLQFAKSGCRVLGLDIDPSKIKEIEAGRSYIRHIPAEDVTTQVKAGRFKASSDFSLVKDSEAVVICVPTPLNKNREPDISYILKTGEAIAPYLRTEDGGRRKEDGGRRTEGGGRKKLVVLESTTYPGTTDEDLRKVLEKGSGLKAGVDFHLAFSPEREDPGNPQSKVAEIPKVVEGLTPACLEKAKELYGKAIKKLVPVSSTRTADIGASLNPWHNSGVQLVRKRVGSMVRTFDLGRFLRDTCSHNPWRPKPCVVMKMDIEGAEIPVLSHLIQRDVLNTLEALYVEWHSKYITRDRKIKRSIKEKSLTKKAFNLTKIRSRI